MNPRITIPDIVESFSMINEAAWSRLKSPYIKSRVQHPYDETSSKSVRYVRAHASFGLNEEVIKSVTQYDIENDELAVEYANRIIAIMDQDWVAGLDPSARQAVMFVGALALQTYIHWTPTVTWGGLVQWLNAETGTRVTIEDPDEAYLYVRKKKLKLGICSWHAVRHLAPVELKIHQGVVRGKTCRGPLEQYLLYRCKKRELPHFDWDSIRDRVLDFGPASVFIHCDDTEERNYHRWISGEAGISPDFFYDDERYAQAISREEDASEYDSGEGTESSNLTTMLTITRAWQALETVLDRRFQVERIALFQDLMAIPYQGRLKRG